MDLLGYLQRALESNRLVVTLPWIVAFLGMMDPVAPHLPSYRPLLQLLVDMYHSLPFPHVSPLTSLLLRCTLGWLFDASFFPQTVFFSLFSSSTQITSKLHLKHLSLFYSIFHLDLQCNLSNPN